MKRSQIGVVVFSMMFGLSVAVIPNRDQPFRGEIMDSFCAGVGSHETITNNFKSARDCTISCVKFGAKYVLYSSSRNKAYRLDNQQTPALFAGEKVQVTGTYDDETNTIHVKTIRPTFLASLKEFCSDVRADFVRP
jgi:hypothetical protein